MCSCVCVRANTQIWRTKQRTTKQNQKKKQHQQQTNLPEYSRHRVEVRKIMMKPNFFSETRKPTKKKQQDEPRCIKPTSITNTNSTSLMCVENSPTRQDNLRLYGNTIQQK